MPRARLVYVGAGGANGSSLLAGMVASRRYAQVTVLTRKGFLHMPHAMADCVVDLPSWTTGSGCGLRLPQADAAVLNFGAARYDREAIFWNPARRELLPLATALRRNGVCTLRIVLPAAATHRRGGPCWNALGAAERAALDKLGFDELDVVEPPGLLSGTASAKPLARLALWMLNTLFQAMHTRPDGVFKVNRR